MCIVTNRFRALPPKGKPQPNEFTVLAGIVLLQPLGPSSPPPFPEPSATAAPTAPWPPPAHYSLQCVALGTGTKCLGRSKRLPQGFAVHDCHAEALARRALLPWVHQELLAASLALPSAFERVPQTNAPGAFALRPGTALALYVSQPPCGDASICDGAAVAAVAGRTGAKPLAPCGAVPAAGDVERGPQVTGRLRRKPGKGDPTLSMSCSDKILRWSFLGLQGSPLMAHLSAPLRLAALVVGGGAEGGEGARRGVMAALRRAFWERGLSRPSLPAPFGLPRPPFIAAVSSPPAALGLAPQGARTIGSGASLAWTAASEPLRKLQLSEKNLDAAVWRVLPVQLEKAGSVAVVQATTGLKLGAGKVQGGAEYEKVSPEVSRWGLRQRFLRLDLHLRGTREGDSDTKSVPVTGSSDAEADLEAQPVGRRPKTEAYASLWESLKADVDGPFHGWIPKV